MSWQPRFKSQVLILAFVICLIRPLELFPQFDSRVLGRIDERKTVRVGGSVHPLAVSANDRGRVSGSVLMAHLTLVLKGSDTQDRDATRLIEEQNDPDSPNFQKWISPKEFGERFGPSAENIQKVTDWLTEHGLVVDGIAAGRRTIDFHGTVSQVEGAFQTEIHNFELEGGLHIANAYPVTIPAALAPVVSGVTSLAKVPARKNPTPSLIANTRLLSSISPETTYYPNTPYEAHYLSPLDFRTIYNIRTLGPNIDGTGQTIAIIGTSDIDLKDVSDFQTIFGLPGKAPTIKYASDTRGKNDSEGEGILDVEWAGAIAPGANIVYVTSPYSSSSTADKYEALLNAVKYAVNQNPRIADIISVSFGNRLCEKTLGASDNLFFLNSWFQAALNGTAVVVSAGDSGSAGCDDQHGSIAQNGLAVNGVASTPFNVAVGGTEFCDGPQITMNATIFCNSLNTRDFWNSNNGANFDSAKDYIREAVWNNSEPDGVPKSLWAGSGGRSSCAQYDASGNCRGYPKPSWQFGVGVPREDGVRDLPDISLAAAEHNAYLICQADLNGHPCVDASSLSIAYGTSASAPAFAGILALLNQKTGRNSATPYKNLYAAAAASTSSFHDIVDGTNAVPCTGINQCNSYGWMYGYAAGIRYDLATGLGSPNVAELAKYWWASLPNPQLSVSPKIGPQTTTFTFSATGFTAGGSIQPYRIFPDGAKQTLAVVTADGAGSASWTDITQCSDLLGNWNDYAVDVVTGKQTAVATFAITANISCNPASDSNYNLTVNSSNPSSGVYILASATDKNGSDAGITSFSLTYDRDKQVTLTAPATAFGNSFSSWTGCDQAPGTTCTVAMIASKVVTANYIPSTSSTQIAHFSYGQVMLGSGFSAVGVAVDGSGNVFVADTNNGEVKEILAAGGYTSIRTLGSGFSKPTGVAVDRIGNVFVADWSDAAVFEILAAGDYTTVKKLGGNVSSPVGVAVDSSSNVFVTDSGDKTVKEISAANGYAVANTLASGLISPYGIAIDGSANLFVGDLHAVKEISASTGYSTISTLPGAWPSGPGTFTGVAIDESENIFLAKVGGNGVYKGLSAKNYAVVETLGSGLTSAEGVSVDKRGNIFVAAPSLNSVIELVPGIVDFGNVAIGQTSAIVPLTFTFDTNVTLGGFSALNGSSELDFTAVSGGTCTANTAYVTGATCTVDSAFAPKSAGILSGTVVLQDSSGNTIATAYLLGTGMTGSGSTTATLNSITVSPASATISPTGTQQFTATGRYSDSSTLDLTGTATWTSLNTAVATINAFGLATAVAGGNTSISASLNGVISDASVLTVESGSYIAPTKPVGTVSGTQSATILLSSSFTLQLIKVVTQGIQNLDFNVAPGSTCTAGTTYSAGQTCTVNFTFTPKAPGLRMGAIQLLDGGGFVKATEYISGTGTGPQLSFFPGVQSDIGGGFITPSGLATNAAGDVFVADYGNNAVQQLLAPLSGTVNTHFYTGLNKPTGIAVDGAGNIFVADSGSNSVILIASISGQHTALTGAFNAPWAVAVDGSGNVFVADSGNNVVKELLAQDGYISVKTLGAGFNLPKGIAVDGAGNVFVGDSGNHVVKEITKASGYTDVVSLGNTFNSPMGVAVDASGNVFVADSGNNAVYEILVAGGYKQVAALGAGFSAPIGVALDPSGNVFVADSLHNRIVRLDLWDAPTLGFASTPVGSNSSDSPRTVTLANNGNAALTFKIPSVGSNPSISPNFTLDSSGGTACPLIVSSSPAVGTLLVGATCTLPISFGPISVGNISGSLVLTDDNMNTPDATQTILLNGTGTGGSISTTTNLSSSLNPSSYGQAVTITATVTAVNVIAQPTGTVQFSVDGSALGSAVAVNGGIATYSTSALTVGTHNLTAAYSPTASSNFTASSSAALSQVINKVAPGVTVTPNSSSISTAQSLSVTIVVNGGTGNPLPTGSVTLNGGGYSSAATPLTSGSATIIIPAGSLAVGVDTLTVSYAPDSGGTSIYTASTGSSSVTVTSFSKITPTVVVTPSSSSITTAQALSVMIAVGGSALPTGAVTLTGGGYTSAATTLVGGSTTINIPAGSLAIGTDTLTGTYTPDSGSLSTYNGASGTTSVIVTSPSIGTAPQIKFLPDSQSTVSSAFSAPAGIAVDGSGNIFVTDQATNSIREILASSGYTTISTLVSGLKYPSALAVDGNGNVFFADTNNNAVKEILAAGGYATVKTLGSGFNSPFGVAVDGSGNVFVTDTNNNAVKEILSASGYVTVTTLGRGFNGPRGIAVDGGGNIFVTDGSATSASAAVKEILAAGGYATVNTLASGSSWAAPEGIAVDGNGNVFVADVAYYNTVREILAASGYNTVITLASGINRPFGVVLDKNRNILVTENSGGRILKLDFVDPPSLGFQATAVGSRSSDSPQTVTVWNDGNTALAFSIPSSGNNPSISSNFALGSAAGTTCPLVASSSSSVGTLAAGASCTLSISFVPTVAGSITGTLILTDNNLNVPNSTQTILLSGTATGATKVTPTIIVTPSASSITTSQSLTVTVAVGGTPTPTGTVVLSGGGYSSAAITLTSGSATISIPANSLSVGTDTLTVNYAPDATSSSTFNSATGSATVTVTTPAKTTPSVSVAPSASSITTTQALSVTVAVSGTPTPTGSVVLSSGTFTSAAASLSGGSTTINIPAGSLAIGSNTLTASYTPDSSSSATYNSSTGTSPAVTVMKSTPVITVTPSASSITTAQSLTVSVAVSGTPTPTGSVVLSSGTFTSAATSLIGGSATINIPGGSLAAGTVTLTVSYSGDSSYNSGTATAAVTVTAGVNPSFTISGTAVSVARGAVAGNTSTISVTPVGGFTGSIALTAVITSSPTGAQYPPTLSFGSTSPVSIAGTTAGTATLTISTTAASTAALSYPKKQGASFYTASGIAVACLLLFGIPARRRRWRALFGMVLLLITFTGGMIACGGGATKSGGGGISNPGTTAGNYTVTVTGTSGSTSATGTVTLTVQK